MKGTIPIGGGTLDVEIDKVDLSQVAPLGDVVSVPIKGVANGKLEISNDGQKWSKAVGSLDLTVADVAIGDGKAKLAGMATLPHGAAGHPGDLGQGDRRHPEVRQVRCDRKRRAAGRRTAICV